ncbi:MAG: hypothetical protein IJ153_10925 [Clostridia bacterium]|nr:hypothetical protein [Clostridia bacterium]MBQ9212199.1 hypothetical protein [Clostridia bacterium]
MNTAPNPDVAFLCVDPDLGAQPFKVTRRKGKWVKGSMTVTSTETLNPIGIIQPTSAEELAQFPEGERRRAMITIYTTTMLYMSEGEDFSDDVTWHDEQYKVMRSDRWRDYGYCVAYCQKR